MLNASYSNLSDASAATEGVYDGTFVDTFVITFIVPLYCVLFVIGMTGNLWVISMLFQIYHTYSDAKQNPIFVYVLTLSVIDALVLLCVPATVMDMVADEWLLGNLACKLYFLLEANNKFASTFLLRLRLPPGGRVARQVHGRQLGPGGRAPDGRAQRRDLRRRVAGHAHARAATVDDLHTRAKTSQARPLHELNMTTVKCMTDLSPIMRKVFIGYSFLLGYLCPALVITACYGSMIASLVFSSLRNMQSRIPMKKVVVSTFLVVAFYYAVWTPYWLLVFLFMFADVHELLGSQLYYMTTYIVHALPYTGSACNWVFYAYLNSRLRSTYTEAKELRMARTRASQAINATLLEAPVDSGGRRRSTPVPVKAPARLPCMSQLRAISLSSRVLSLSKGACHNPDPVARNGAGLRQLSFDSRIGSPWCDGGESQQQILDGHFPQDNGSVAVTLRLSTNNRGSVKGRLAAASRPQQPSGKRPGTHCALVLSNPNALSGDPDGKAVAAAPTFALETPTSEEGDSGSQVGDEQSIQL